MVARSEEFDKLALRRGDRVRRVLVVRALRQVQGDGDAVNAGRPFEKLSTGPGDVRRLRG